MLCLVCRAAPIAAAIVILSAPGLTTALGDASLAGDVSDRDLERLDAAARQYRVQVYQTYRLERDEFDRRKAAGDEVQARWRAAGERSEDLSAVLRWLEQGAYFSQPEVRQNLPTFPVFGAPRNLHAEKGSKSNARPDAPEESPSSGVRRLNQQTVPPTGRVTGQPYVQVRPSPAPRVGGYEIAPPRQFAPVRPEQGAIVPPPARLPEGHQQGPARVAARPQVGRALVPAPWEVVSPAPAPPNTGNGPVPVRRAEIGLPPASSRVDRPSRLPAGVNAPARAAPGLVTAPPVQPSPAIDAGQESGRKMGSPTTIGKPANQSEDAVLPAPAPAVAQRRPRGRDFAGRPSGAPTASPRVALARPDIARAAVDARSILAKQSRTAELVPPAGQLNVGELLARASGYGFGLRTIDSVLQEQTSLNPAELADLLSELEALVDQRGDLMLYQQLVSADIRERLVRSLDFPQTTVAELGSRIAAARERLTQQSGLAAPERELSLQALADLSKRLSRLSQTSAFEPAAANR